MTMHEPLTPLHKEDASWGIDACIPRGAFPSSRDQLLVTLVRHHAPSSLLWELSRLPEGHVFTDAREVEEALRSSSRVTTPLEPW